MAIYFLSVYAYAWFGMNRFNDWYIILLELCVCSVMSSQGKYHCKYIKFTAYGLTASDFVTRLDGAYDIFPLTWAVLLPPTLAFIGIVTSTFFAFRHFYRVWNLQKKKEIR